MMRPNILKQNRATEFDTPERCFIIETANDLDDEAVSIARARVEPGVTTAWHQLNGVVERYIIVSGTGCVEVGNLEPTAVSAGDVVRIPADTRQRITNEGNEALIFYAVCSPRFLPDCYIALE